MKAITFGGQQEHGIRPRNVPVTFVEGIGMDSRLAYDEYEQIIKEIKN